MKIPFTTLIFILAVLLLAGLIAYFEHKKQAAPVNNQTIIGILDNEADSSNTKDTLSDD